MPTILDVKGVGPSLAAELAKQGILTPEQLAGLRTEDLLTVSGVGPARANLLIAAAKAAVDGLRSGDDVKTKPAPAIATKKTEQTSSSASGQAKANTKPAQMRPADSKSKPRSSVVDPVTRALKKEVKKRQAALEKQKAKLKLAKKALKELK